MKLVFDVRPPKISNGITLCSYGLSPTIVGFKVHVKIAVDISVRWSFAIGFGVVTNFLETMENLMKHLIAIVSIGAALLPVPGWHKLHHTERGVDWMW